MIYFRCLHSGFEHESSFQTVRALWAARRDTVVTDECPNTGRPVAYRLRDTYAT